jgi:ribonuclease HI
LVVLAVWEDAKALVPKHESESTTKGRKVKMEEYQAWFDGGCGPCNPSGTATTAAIVKTKDGTVLLREGRLAGTGKGMSNNVAEYAAIIRVFEYLLSRSPGKVTVHGDSRLVIKQLSAKWNVGEGLYRAVALEAKQLLARLRSLGWQVNLLWIPRNQNKECDSLSKATLADAGSLPEFQALGIPTEPCVDPVDKGTAP